VLSDFERGSINWTRPWLLMMIELWCREVVDRCGAAVRSHGSAGGAHRTQHAGSR
jgi:hypothetical protein